MKLESFVMAGLAACLLVATPKRPVSGGSEVNLARSQAKQPMPKELLRSLVGTWEGTSRTWFTPAKVADESKIKGTFTAVLGGRFIRHEYDSTMLGKPRHGEELMVFNSIGKRFQVSWFDSFHMPAGILFSEGEATEHGFVVRAKYDVGEGKEPWGWNTYYEMADADHLTITSYNVKPGEKEQKAVETVYTRSK